MRLAPGADELKAHDAAGLVLKLKLKASILMEAQYVRSAQSHIADDTKTDWIIHELSLKWAYSFLCAKLGSVDESLEDPCVCIRVFERSGETIY